MGGKKIDSITYGTLRNRDRLGGVWPPCENLTTWIQSYAVVVTH